MKSCVELHFINKTLKKEKIIITKAKNRIVLSSFEIKKKKYFLPAFQFISVKMMMHVVDWMAKKIKDIYLNTYFSYTT